MRVITVLLASCVFMGTVAAQGKQDRSEDPCNRGNKCKPGTKVADPADCQRYYECENAVTWTRRPCAPSTNFDTEKRQCVHEQEAKCHGACDDVTSTTFPPSTTFPAEIPEPRPRRGKTRLLQVTGTAVEGKALLFRCEHGPTSQPYPLSDVTFTWQLNDVTLTNGRRLRISNSVVGNRKYISNVFFNKASWKDSGRLTCNVTTPSDTGRATKEYCVHPRPPARFTTMTISVPRGEQVTITCTVLKERRGCLVERPAFIWYRNSTKFDGNEVTEEYVSVLTVRADDDTMYSCQATNNAGAGNMADLELTVIHPDDSGATVCMAETHRGVTWPATKLGRTAKQSCPRNATGIATRTCVLTESSSTASWQEPNMNHCVHQSFSELLATIEEVEDGRGLDDPEVIEGLSGNLATITETVQSGGSSQPGNINVGVACLEKLAMIRVQNPRVPISEKELTSSVQTGSNLVRRASRESWAELTREDASRGVALMWSVEQYGRVYAAQHVNDSIVQTENIVLETRIVNNASGDVAVPAHAPPTNMSDRIALRPETVRQIMNDLGMDELGISSVTYETLHHVLPENGSAINSRILSLSVSTNQSIENLSPPVELRLAHSETLLGNQTAKCAFWNFSAQFGTHGGWSTKGCHVVESTDDVTVCKCDHLTNFAIMVGHYYAEGGHHIALSVISIVGCALSILGLSITIILYVMLWRFVKSHHAVVLLNLCLALIIANCVFLLGIGRTANKDMCTAAAVFLHYFYLAAFFLMLSEGVLLLIYIIFVFHVRRKRETAGLIVAGWAVPAVIVAISVGVTQTQGYGNERFCWLSYETGLIWAFLAPVIFIIIVNCVILVIVLRRIASSKLAQSEDGNDNIKSMMWNLVVMLPVLGITWVVGMFAVSQETLVFQYLFAIFNSAQGVFIFLFHCFFNRKVRESFSEQYQSTSTAFSSLRPLLKKRGAYEVHDTKKNGDQPASDEVAMSDTSRDSAPSNNNADSDAQAETNTPPVVLLSNTHGTISDA